MQFEYALPSSGIIAESAQAHVSTTVPDHALLGTSCCCSRHVCSGGRLSCGGSLCNSSLVPRSGPPPHQRRQVEVCGQQPSVHYGRTYHSPTRSRPPAACICELRYEDAGGFSVYALAARRGSNLAACLCSRTQLRLPQAADDGHQNFVQHV